MRLSHEQVEQIGHAITERPGIAFVEITPRADDTLVVVRGNSHGQVRAAIDAVARASDVVCVDGHRSMDAKGVTHEVFFRDRAPVAHTLIHIL